MKQVNIDISDKIVSGVLSSINRKRIYIRTADWDTVMSRFDEYDLYLQQKPVEIQGNLYWLVIYNSRTSSPAWRACTLHSYW